MPTEERWHSAASVALRALADREAAGREHRDAVQALEDAVRRGAPPARCLPLFEDVRNTEVCWRKESVDAVCRTVGAYLIENGHGEAWRALFPCLVGGFDVWTGPSDSYDFGDDVLFVKEAGWYARDKDAGNH